MGNSPPPSLSVCLKEASRHHIQIGLQYKMFLGKLHYYKISYLYYETRNKLFKFEIENYSTKNMISLRTFLLSLN